MLCHVWSGVLNGVDAIPVRVEVNVGSGLPSFSVVGLPEGAVREGKERVLTALGNSGFSVPPRRITVNLAPASLRKEGTALDLPIAMGILGATGTTPIQASSRRGFLGELSLDGSLRPVRGVLAAVMALREIGVSEVLVPHANAPEAAIVSGIRVLAAESLKGAVGHVRSEVRLSPHPGGNPPASRESVAGSSVLTQIRGQSLALRAVEIAAAGGHNLLLVGPPGAGKTLLARALGEILPPLSPEEMLEVTRVRSAAGLLTEGWEARLARPFRAPHHTASYAGMVGGGPQVRPGEVTLAHRGVLFLDELPEFQRRVLETLRQPLETGSITIVRARDGVRLPARFSLVAAMNPCPCGLGDADDDSRCSCSPSQVARYRSRVSGPLLDRMDLRIRVPPLSAMDLTRVGRTGTPARQMRERVMRARAVQLKRYSEEGGVFCNGDLPSEQIDRWVPLRGEALQLLRDVHGRLGLSARGFHRLIRVARTIADLGSESSVGRTHLLEAIRYQEPFAPLNREGG